MDIARRVLGALEEFLASETLGGFALVAASLVGLLFANSGLSADYFHLLETKLAIGTLKLSVLHWVNDGLMVLFFLLVGLEIKRELLTGELSSVRRALLPVIGAAGGMIAPALIFLGAATLGAPAHPDTARGWAIPAATDIAFALAALSMVGRHLPSSLTVFLSALAIIDDLGAILVIAFFYTSDLNMPALAAAGVALVGLVALNLVGTRRLPAYLALGVVLWIAVLQSGVHATIAGVLLALTIPINGPHGALARLEHALHKPVALFIVPLFGFANAGVDLGGVSFATLVDPVTLGIGFGLLIGKQIGVFGFAWAAVRSGVAALPEGAGWSALYGVAALCGIGFTMSLFIGGLAFPPPLYVTETKLGIFAGSLLSVALGGAWLRFATRR